MEEESSRGFQNWLKLVFRRLGRVENPENIEKEIQQLIDEGEERGLISEDEGEMIQGIFSFRDTIAREIMVPRTDTVCARVESSVREIIDLIIQSGHSRIPIFQENIDNIIGILHAKDILPFWGKEDFDVRDVVRAPYFIPETKKISEVLRDLRDKKSHMAIIIDEYGGTAGILTLENIIEEIIGEIMDEYDADENWIVELNDGSVVVDARLDIEELEDYLKVEFPDGSFESVGGFIINHLGRVPNTDETLTYDGLEFTITVADSRKIEKIRIHKVDHEAVASQSTGEGFY